MSTKIEWTHPPGYKGETWNVLQGCTRVSPGCEHCYAERIAARFQHTNSPFAGVAEMRHGKPRWTGEIKFNPDKLELPYRWKKPRCVFVNSMSDLFHGKVSDKWLGSIFRVMLDTPQHIYQILTKRPERMRAKLLPEGWWGDAVRDGRANHIWLGVSVENQEAANERIPLLINMPAAVRFLSIEPLLERVDLGRIFSIHQVIVGGESGPGARPMEVEWVRKIRRQCANAGVAFFMKQGSHANWGNYKDFDSFPADLRLREYP